MTSPHWSRPPPSSPVITTSVELAEHYLRRSESVPGAYVNFTPSLALEQARAADEAVAQGRAEGELFEVVPGEVTCSSWPERTPGWVRRPSTSSYADDNVVQGYARCLVWFYSARLNTRSSVCPATPNNRPRSRTASPLRLGRTPHRWRIVRWCRGGSCRRPGASSRFGRWRFGAHPASANGLVGIKPLPRAHQQRPAAPDPRRGPLVNSGPSRGWPMLPRCWMMSGPFPATLLRTSARDEFSGGGASSVRRRVSSSPTRSSPTCRWTRKAPPPSSGRDDC